MGLSALTDLFDGLLARRWKVTSTFGALADPLMDKVFYIVMLPVLMFVALVGGSTDVVYHQGGVEYFCRWRGGGDIGHGLALLALTVASLLRDQWVSFLRSVGMMYGADVKANWAGKLRTAIAFPIIMIIYAFLGLLKQGEVPLPVWTYDVVFALEAALLFITILSAWIYTRGYWKHLKKAME